MDIEAVSISKEKHKPNCKLFMGEGFMRGVHPPFTNFYDFWLRSSTHEKDFLPECYQYYLWLKDFDLNFSFSRCFGGNPKGECTRPTNSEVFFQTHRSRQVARKICIDMKLCMYTNLDTSESLKQFWGIHDLFMTSSMSDFFATVS